MKMIMLRAVWFKKNAWASNQECGETESLSKPSLVRLTFSLKLGNNSLGTIPDILYFID